MTVYIDCYNAPFQRMIMCHMIADTIPELHAMADTIGIARRWFQSKGRTPHYDICKSKKTIALKNGAKEVGMADFVGHANRIRESGAWK